MSRFYAEIQGSRGVASRMGGKDSGIWAHVRGWDVGVRVSGGSDGDADYFVLYATHGSNGRGADKVLGVVQLVDGAPTFTPAETEGC